MKDTVIALAVQNSRIGAIDRNLEKCIEMAVQAASDGASLVLFPEMNLTGYTTGKDLIRPAAPLTDTIRSTLLDTAEKNAVAILAGMVLQAEDTRVFAAHFAALPDRSFFTYKKIHAAPVEKPFLSCGSRMDVFENDGLTFGIQLCYDAHFPELSTHMALEGADLILIPHASPGGTPSEKIDSWTRHLRARAFDNGLFIGACNQVGANGGTLEFPGAAVVIGPDGHVISTYTESREGLLLATLEESKLSAVRSHRMKYFLPHRRDDLY